VAVAGAVKSAEREAGYLHKVPVQVASENEVREAINAGADVLVIEDLSAKEFARLGERGA
jgi:nicotinate-nucleotide pyrophosphorylase